MRETAAGKTHYGTDRPLCCPQSRRCRLDVCPEAVTCLNCLRHGRDGMFWAELIREYGRRNAA